MDTMTVYAQNKNDDRQSNVHFNAAAKNLPNILQGVTNLGDRFKNIC